MAQLGSTSIFGKLKVTAKALINGELEVLDTLRAKSGIFVEGGDIDEYATIRAGDNADSGHLMIESSGGNIYLNRTDGGEIRIEGNLVDGITKLDGDNGNHRIRFDSDSSWIEITDQSNNRRQLVTQDVYVDDSGTWIGSDHIGNNNAHHSKTTSASELTDVSADSVSGAHHSRYSDGEAQDAVDGASLSTLTLGSQLTVPTYQSTSDVPSLPQGTVVFITNDNSLYVEDGT